MSIGLILIGWTLKAGADNIHVTAKVPAPPLTITPVITSPTDGSHFNAIPIPVKGTCEYGSYLKLYRNNFFSGSAVCTSGGEFALDSDLFPGKNDLMVRSFNITDDEGPSSSVVSVYYDVPMPPSISAPTSFTPGASPFTITTDFKHVGYRYGQTVKWSIQVSGGTAPYALNIDWGDGANLVISRKEPGIFQIEHQYGYKDQSHTFIIKISASDSAGQKAYLQMFITANSSVVPAVVGNIRTPSNQWLILAWPAYLLVFFALFSFWLGEKEEVLRLKKRGLLRPKAS